MSNVDLAPFDADAQLARVRQLFERSIALKTRVSDQHAPTIVAMAHAMARTIRDGGKLLFCGNGGSAADAQHLAAEMLVRLRPQVNRRAFPALALALDTSSLTACGNDFEFEAYYERMIQALGAPGDALVGITTSGRSENVVRALRAARSGGLRTLGLLGGSGEPAQAACDLAIVVPSDETGRVQEMHITIGHALLEIVEDLLSATAG
jgi:D-sedoheptulose 7-phosphate isomerase